MKLTEAPKTDKRTHLDRLLEKGTVMIFVDSRHADVNVPAAHKENVQLMLNLDYAFEIPDFKIAEDRIEASLSFNGQNSFCIVPLDAIYAFSSKVNEEIVVFPEDIPQNADGTSLPPLMAATAPAPLGLALVDEKSPAPAPLPSESQPEAEKPKRPHLRLVK